MDSKYTEDSNFIVVKQNQYDLPVGKKDVPCPICSEGRTNGNKKKPCAQLDWESGIGTCLNGGPEHAGGPVSKNGNPIFFLHKRVKKDEGKWDIPAQPTKFPISKEALEFFKGRGISEETVRKMRITSGDRSFGEAPEKSISFNYYENDVVRLIKYRALKDKKFNTTANSKKVFYNLDSIANKDKCIIVEGEMDVLTFIENGINEVVSVPFGAKNSKNVQLDELDHSYDAYFKNKTEIIIAHDNDETGKALKDELVRRLNSPKTTIKTIDWEDCKDANEYFVKHGQIAFKQQHAKAKMVPIEGVRSLRERKTREAFKEYLKNGHEKGFVTGVTSLDDNFSALLGQFITITGIPGHGKTDFADQMTIGYNQNYGWKTAFASVETEWKDHFKKLGSKIAGKWLQPEDIDKEEYQQHLDRLEDNFLLIDMNRYYLEDVLLKAEELVRKKGIKCLVIDPFNKIPIKDSAIRRGNMQDYVMEYLRLVDEFCQKHNVLVLLVAHPRKMETMNDPKGQINPNNPAVYKVPSLYDIKGAGEWADASYHALCVYRDYSDPDLKVQPTQVHVLKCKNSALGTAGKIAKVWWDNSQGGRYVQSDINDDSEWSQPTREEQGLPWEP